MRRILTFSRLTKPDRDARIFASQACQHCAGRFKSRQMISKNKQDCIYDLSSSILRSEKWRSQLEVKYHDPRNGRAAERLNRLALEIGDLTDEQFSELKPFYSWSSPTWSEAVSQTSRLVEFRNVNTLPAFVSALLGILSEQH